jgi:hypothetical protein
MFDFWITLINQERLFKTDIGFERPNIRIAHYKMLKHGTRVKNPLRIKLLKKAQDRYRTDGLNSVTYRLVSVEKYALYTHMFIDVGRAPPELLRAIQNASSATKRPVSTSKRQKNTTRTNEWSLEKIPK